MKHFIKLWFDTYVRIGDIENVAVWEMQEGKKTRYQVLVCTHHRYLVYHRCDTHEEAVGKQVSLLQKMDKYLSDGETAYKIRR